MNLGQVISRNTEAPTLTDLSPRRLVSRQPIFSGNRDVVGYELLFRTGWHSCFFPDSAEASEQAWIECLHTGIETLTAKQLAFIKCTREDLVTKMVMALPVKTTVLEVPPSSAPSEDDELLAACIELRDMGYLFALDDFLPGPAVAPLLPIASYIKVNLRDTGPEIRRETKRITRGTKAILLATKVDDHLEFAMARAEGFELFQGRFFRNPMLIANRAILPSRMAYLRLMMELARSPINVDEVMRIVQSEPTLCYRLLVMANSPLWGVRSEVTSPRHALNLIGENRFRTLVSVATSCVLGQSQPSALIGLCLKRARFGEMLAPLVGENPSEQFMLGLLSLLDAMLETPMEPLLKTLPLRPEAKAALMGEKAPVGVLLGLIQNLESGDWESCVATARTLGISEEALAGAYVESMKWAAQAVASS
jgi:EAL and modified HD-GYP domain-containing signal transduction protein